MFDLNPEQKKAVTSQCPHIAIIAGPGTGKTKTLIAKIEYLIDNKIPPEKILTITFTNKAAAEIKTRIKYKKGLFIGTFHGLALHILNSNPKIATQSQLLKITSRKKLNEISFAKNNFEKNSELDKYNNALKDKGLIDFDDLLLLLYKTLKEEKTNYDYVLVDEFQDTNSLQYEILKLLNAKNYFVIGDPNQSIYSFRGGEAMIFHKYYTDFPDCKKVVLHQNYRNSHKILKTYNKIFPKIKLSTNNDSESEVYLLETSNEYSEAKWILNHIKDESGGSDLRDASDAKSSFSDFAVLYRNHRFNKILQEKFVESGIPFQIVGEGSVFEDQQVSDLMEKFKTEVEFSLVDLINNISDEGKRDLFRSLTYRFIDKDKSEFINYISKLQEREYHDPTINSVTFLTLHAAKGLEFEKVFICACEEGVIPSKGDIEEEKRLFYVGLSRARKCLYLTKALKRNGKSTVESQFVSLLDIEKLVDTKTQKSKDKLKKYRLKKAQKSLFNL